MNIAKIAEEKAKEYGVKFSDLALGCSYSDGIPFDAEEFELRSIELIKEYWQSCFTHLAGSGEGVIEKLCDAVSDCSNYDGMPFSYDSFEKQAKVLLAAHAAHLYKELEDKDREIANLKEGALILNNMIESLKKSNQTPF